MPLFSASAPCPSSWWSRLDRDLPDFITASSSSQSTPRGHFRCLRVVVLYSVVDVVGGVGGVVEVVDDVVGLLGGEVEVVGGVVDVVGAEVVEVVGAEVVGGVVVVGRGGRRVVVVVVVVVVVPGLHGCPMHCGPK